MRFLFCLLILIIYWFDLIVLGEKTKICCCEYKNLEYDKTINGKWECKATYLDFTDKMTRLILTYPYKCYTIDEETFNRYVYNYLYISECTDVDFSRVKTIRNLQHLQVNQSSFSNLEEFITRTEVQKIFLSNNGLKKVGDFTMIRFLQILDLSYNEIEFIEEPLFSPSSEKIYLNNNRIRFIHPILSNDN